MEKFLNIFKIPDLRKKLVFTSLLLLVYRLGGKVPIPGIDKTALASMSVLSKDFNVFVMSSSY